MVRNLRRRDATTAPPPSANTVVILDGLLRRPTGGLWANANFLNLWTAETIAQVGSQVSPVAIPLLAALTLNATAFQMGVLTAASGVPVLILGLLAGAWVDRLRKKPLMMAMDIGRALVLLAIPVTAMLDILSIPLLVAVALLTGSQSVVFNAAYVSILPGLVKRSELSDANGKLYASMSVAQVIGPATAGTLISLLSAPVVMAINSLTYLGSAFYIRRIDHHEDLDSASTDDRHLLREVSEGFRALFSSPVLRAIALSSATINLAGWMFLAVYVLYMTADLGLSATGVGLVFASGGAGALLGSLVASRLANRFGVGRAMVWAAILFGVSGLSVPMAVLAPDHALPLIVFAEFAQWMTLVVFNVLGLSLRQTLTPARLLGRVAASNQVLSQGMMPIGSFLGGVIGSLASVQAALLTGVFGMFLAAGWVLFSPVPGIRQMPAEPVDGDHSG